MDDFEELSDRQLARVADVYDMSTKFVEEWKRDENWFEEKVREYLAENITLKLDADEVAIVHAIIGRESVSTKESKAIWCAEIHELQQAVVEMNSALCNHNGIDEPWKDLKKKFKALKKCVAADEFSNMHV